MPFGSEQLPTNKDTIYVVSGLPRSGTSIGALHGWYYKMSIHTLAGLPRSGSTLIANVLSQHPDVHVSGTSALSNVLDSMQGVLTNDPTVISEMTANTGMVERYRSALNGFIDGWYSGINEPVIVDKGRTWAPLWILSRDLDPSRKMLCTIRDPRDVIASIEKQHQNSGLFRSPVAPLLRDSAEKLMEPTGLVGAPMRWVEDMIRRKSPGVLFIRYESFVASPAPVMTAISKHLELSEFEWDFDNIVSRGGDGDQVWRGKYPHDGTGAIKPSEGSWEDTIDPELGKLIAGVCPLYMSTFSYGV